MSQADADQRDGKHKIWIAATLNDRIASKDRLTLVAGKVSVPGVATRVTLHDHVPCIEISGERTPRNAALAIIRESLYADGLKWITTVSDFDWLRLHARP